MVSKHTIHYLTDYLVGKISPSIPPGWGSEDNKPVKLKEAQLQDLFENHIYVSGSGYFLYSYTGTIWVYNGRHYEMVTTESFLKEVLKQSLKKLDVGLVYQKFSPKRIADECITSMENRFDGRFEEDRRYIVFNNGVFDVKEGVLKDFGMEYRTDIILDIDYDPMASSPLWEEKLVEILPHEASRRDFQMWCGALLNNRNEHKMELACFILGPGSNGKSVIAEAVTDVFGSVYFRKFQPDQLLKDNSRMFNLAALQGAIANFCGDMKKENISSTGFKSFVSGEEFEARHPFGRVVFKVKAPMLLCCANEMPPTTDDSWGYHRRILPIQSTTRIRDDKDADASLTNKLRTKEARSAIFNWIYEGYKMFIANGGKINISEETKALQLELRDDSNSLRRWIRDYGYVKVVREFSHNDDSWKLLKDWHDEYKQYCKDNGDNQPQNTKSMARIFREKGFIELRRRDGIWFCIGRLEDNDAIEEEKKDIFGNPMPRITPDTSEEELPF